MTHVSRDRAGVNRVECEWRHVRRILLAAPMCTTQPIPRAMCTPRVTTHTMLLHRRGRYMSRGSVDDVSKTITHVSTVLVEFSVSGGAHVCRIPCPNCTTHPQRAHMRGPCAASSGRCIKQRAYVHRPRKTDQEKSRFLRGGRWRHLHCTTLLSSRHPTTSIRLLVLVNTTKVRLEELKHPLATSPSTRRTSSDSVRACETMQAWP
jgi:hypothetical protein